MKQKIFKKLKKFLPFIGIILLIYTIYTLDVNKIINAFFLINPIFIIIALSLTLPRLLIRNYVWQIIQKEHNINLTFFQSLKIYMIQEQSLILLKHNLDTILSILKISNKQKLLALKR